MERRTTEYALGRWVLRVPMQEGIDLLAAYENTGLEPKDVISGKELAELACAMNRLKEYQDIGSIEHLRELVQAERDGRLVKVPCEVGTHVWVDGREAVVQEFFGYRRERYLRAQFCDDAERIDIPFDEIGRTALLTDSTLGDGGETPIGREGV